jgi:hypothetical protein
VQGLNDVLYDTEEFLCNRPRHAADTLLVGDRLRLLMDWKPLCGRSREIGAGSAGVSRCLGDDCLLADILAQS